MEIKFTVGQQSLFSHVKRRKQSIGLSTAIAASDGNFVQFMITMATREEFTVRVHSAIHIAYVDVRTW